MTELLTAVQMRAIEQAAIKNGAVTGLELMERAGRGVVEAVLEWRPELALAPHRAVVLCGPGNNGGDGFVVARLLKQRGWEVEVFLYGDEAKLPPDAALNGARWREMGEVQPLTDERFDGWPEPVDRVDLLVDALFGTGLSRPFLDFPKLQMSMNHCQSLSQRNPMAAKVVAIDVPSGMCADSGRLLGDDQPADFAGLANLTVTFHRPRVGHHLADGQLTCSRIAVKDIGLPVDCRSSRSLKGGGVVEIVDRPNGPDANLLSKVWLHGEPHKYRHGHAFILGGGVGKGGAARLAARGALRIGAGLVTVGVPPAALIENAAQLNAIMLRAVRDAGTLGEVLADSRINALCLGPGMGVSERTKDMVLTALSTKRSVVLDADALTVFAEDPAELFDALHEHCVLTPHGGEFARLFPDIAAQLSEPATKGPAFSKVDATRAAAARAGCVLLYKGPDTVIAGPDARCAINSAQYERAAPWLATAGAGDVLEGFITGLLARGFAPMAAAEKAAWLHVECARTFGPGLIAEDLPEQLPRVFRDLLDQDDLR